MPKRGRQYQGTALSWACRINEGSGFVRCVQAEMVGRFNIRRVGVSGATATTTTSSRDAEEIHVTAHGWQEHGLHRSRRIRWSRAGQQLFPIVGHAHFAGGEFGPIRTLGQRRSALVDQQLSVLTHMVSRVLKASEEREGARADDNAEVGERMGVSQPRASQFERYDSNPTLDAVRRYAAAVGARLDTRVIDDHASDLPARQQVALIEQAAPDATREISWESHATEVAS
jgi:transcriptional regulator with XRE-family HTH domain